MAVYLYVPVVPGPATNMIVATPAFIQAQPGTWIERTGDEGIGHIWDGSTWTSPTTTPAPTTAEIAATKELSAVKFKAAIATMLSQPLSSIDTYLEAQISNSSLASDEKDLAIFLLRTANTFHRVDPDIGDSLLAEMAVVLNLGAPGGAWTTETHEQKIAIARAALDLMFTQ